MKTFASPRRHRHVFLILISILLVANFILFSITRFRYSISGDLTLFCKNQPSPDMPFSSGFKNCFDGLPVRDNIQELVSYLYKINAFVVDIEALNGTQMHNNVNYLSRTCCAGLTYGIFNQSIQFEKFSELGFDISQSSSVYSNDNILTNVYLKSNGCEFQIAVFYNFVNFYWIGKANNTHSIVSKWFGDTPRVINKFYLKSVSDGDKSFLVPSKIDQFLYEYSYSKFIECDKGMVAMNNQVYGTKYSQNQTLNAKALPVLRQIIGKLEQLKMHYWLAAGTLLGWYRECGIIPHTSDIDLGIPNYEYTEEFKNFFIGNSHAPLVLTFGLINDSYELRVFKDSVQFDMFIVYKHNDTHQWCGYQEQRKKFKRYLPNFTQYCSGELFKSKVMVPCDPIGYLNNEYGDGENWMKPKKAGYNWPNLDRIHGLNWSDADWPYAIRFYNKNGQVDVNQTIAFINQNSKLNLLKLPN